MVPAAIRERQLSQINLDDSSQYLPLNDVFIGDKARRYLEGENDLANGEKRAFYEVCKEFWLSAAKYAVKKLPVESEFLANLTWLNPGVQEYSMYNQVIKTLQHLPQVVKEEEQAALDEEFLDYCTCDHVKELTAATAIDAYWHKIGQLQDPTGEPRYPVLSRLAKAILIIPHGNADVERSFSKMGLNKTKLCNSLGTDTLNALLQLQCNVQDTCYTFRPTPETVSLCRNAIASLDDSD